MRGFLLLAAVGLYGTGMAPFAMAPDAVAQESYFGFLPTPSDEYESFPKLPKYRSYLPEAVDLSSRFPTPGQQGRLNSCVGWAVGYAARSYYAVIREGRARNKARDIPSPSYIYHLIREPRNCQSGSRIPEALELLKTGSLSLSDLPYRASCSKPSVRQRKAARDFRIDKWMSAREPKRVDAIKGQLAMGHPVMIGLDVARSFLRLKGRKIYRARVARAGRHAVTVVGYSDRRQAFKIINSYGTQWGDRGFGWISYDTFSRTVLEAYVMRVKEAAPKPLREEKVVAPAPQPKPRVDPPPEKEETIADVTPAPRPPPQTEREEVKPPAPDPFVDTTPDDDCQALWAVREKSTIEIVGFVGTQAALDRVKRQYPPPKYKVNVIVRPWPQCELLLTLGNRLFAENVPHMETADGTYVRTAGDNLAIEVTTGPKPAYIYITYVQADGSVVHLHQPGPGPSVTKSATKFVFGDGKDGRARFTVSKPFGAEMIIALASASPLFEAPLPDNQNDRDYLSALRKALIYKSDPSLPDRQVAATFRIVTTQEKDP